MAISKIVYKASANATPEVWMDATPATAAAADIVAPKTAMLANGVVTTGTGTGGGGGGNFGRKDVNFYDYDGSIIASYTTSEFANISELPANPSHTGLVAQGWNMPSNWELSDAKTYIATNGKADWGQMYVTVSGDTEIDISLNDANYLSPYLAIAVNGTVEVDWGDNSTADTLTGTSDGALVYQLHQYSTTGDYKISIHVVSGKFTFRGTSLYASVLRTVAADNDRARSLTYSSSIKAIWIGNNAFLSNYAFQYCSSMMSVTIPSNISQIRSYAFAFCYRLQYVTIPISVTAIEDYTFTNCFLMASISIPNSVTSIGEYVFPYCISLSVTIPNSITYIGVAAFEYCYILSNIKIPNAVSAINSYAFYYCYGLKSIVIPSGIETIYQYAFARCYYLENVSIPNSVTSVGNYAFNYCWSLKDIEIPSNITTISQYAFACCYSLTDITIPANVTRINASAFSSCWSLTKMTVPSSVTYIASLAFEKCYSITEYHFKPTTPPTLQGTNAFSGIMSGTIMYVPYSEDHSILNAYQTASNWSNYANFMQEEPQ